MSFTKITEADLVDKGVTGLPDVPNLTTLEMQNKFDELSIDVLVPKLNNLIDELEAATAASSLGISNDGTDTNIQDLIDIIKDDIDALENVAHSHGNKDELDTITSGFLEKTASLITLLDGITEISNVVTNNQAIIPTCKAIVDYVTTLGAGDMLKAVYDADNNDVADVAMSQLTDATVYLPGDGDVMVWNGSGWSNRENIGKKLSAQTLSAGSTTLTFSDAKITTDSTIDIYASVYGVSPSAVSVTTGQVVLTFDAQTDAISVYIIVR